MKKGRHRRFEEARALKRNTETLDPDLLDDNVKRVTGEPCPECSAPPGKTHATWCMAEQYSEEEEEEESWG